MITRPEEIINSPVAVHEHAVMSEQIKHGREGVTLTRRGKDLFICPACGSMELAAVHVHEAITDKVEVRTPDRDKTRTAGLI